MSKSDGFTQEISSSNSVSSEVVDRRLSFDADSGQNIPPEIAFRGFEKKPLVLVRRYDITPYLPLKVLKTLQSSELKSLKTVRGFARHLNRLSEKCSINLLREDLDELRRRLLSNQPPPNPSSSSSDTEEDAMADIKCKICDKAYSNEKKLLKHQGKKHMIVYKPHTKPQKRVSFSDHVIIHEVKEYHKCRKCSKIFEAYYQLKIHMKHHHKKRKCYICNYCNKNFADRIFFKVHIKLHCDVCGLYLPNKVKFNNHRRNICRVLKLHKCKTCDEEYFSFMDLKDHSYNHIAPCFVCDVCKDQFNSKCAIAHHIAFLHCNDRPTTLYGMRNLGNERVYLCNFCEESSVERDMLERHIQQLPDLTNRAMTGYKDYYFCDQCFKKFDTETSMLQHKWTHFLKTSDNSQERLEQKKTMKMTYKAGEPIPEYMKPVLVLERIKVGGKDILELVECDGVNTFTVSNGEIKRLDLKSKKTIISKHQCKTCDKYYSSSYCLNRHIETQHSDFDSLRCKVCEETFVWPSLLKSHKCIRLNLPEMPFEDARPEIHFENLQDISQNGFDDLVIMDDDDYMNTVDFDIPAPVVELKDLDNYNAGNGDKFAPLHNLGYKLVMQEVPIEF